MPLRPNQWQVGSEGGETVGEVTAASHANAVRPHLPPLPVQCDRKTSSGGFMVPLLVAGPVHEVSVALTPVPLPGCQGVGRSNARSGSPRQSRHGQWPGQRASARESPPEIPSRPLLPPATRLYALRLWTARGAEGGAAASPVLHDLPRNHASHSLAGERTSSSFARLVRRACLSP